MTNHSTDHRIHPGTVLYQGSKPFPALAACEHYAGSERLIRKALALQAELGPIFDLTCDCEDGAAAGQELAHAAMVADLIMDSANLFDRVGVRIHDVQHPAWQQDLDIILGKAASKVAYVVLPKAENAADVRQQIDYLQASCLTLGISRTIPVHVLIETHGALREIWEICTLPLVESVDFGLMDFVSAHHGALPGNAMTSPLQFEHPLIVRAKTEISAAALANGIVPAHNVTTELRDLSVIAYDARRARQEFGFLRMWSIHPNQILPIVDAMRPSFDEMMDAADLLANAQDADWGPTQWQGKLHDRASYRYYWDLLQQAKATGMALPETALQRFFS